MRARQSNQDAQDMGKDRQIGSDDQDMCLIFATNFKRISMLRMKVRLSQVYKGATDEAKISTSCSF